MNDDEVVGVNLRGDGFGELSGGEDGGEGLEAEVGGEEEAEGSGGEGEVGGVGLGAAAKEEGGEGAEEEAESGQGEGEAEEAEGAGVEVEEVAHAEGVVGGVVGEERGEVGVGCGGVGSEKDIEGCGGEEGAEEKEDGGAALGGAVCGGNPRLRSETWGTRSGGGVRT